MNVPIRRLAVIALVMLLALMGSVTWWQFVRAQDLNNDARNTRSLYREFGVFRGPIVMGGEAMALSEPVNTDYKYLRQYPQGELYAPVTGFYSVVYGRSGLEAAENSVLTGSSSSLLWSRLQDLVTGRQPRGSSIETTIDPVVQQAAWDALGDQRGAVVAIEPATGRILAMVSKPSYDPNLLASHKTSAVSEAWQKLNADPDKPMANRAIAGDTYPPGSVFKLITAATAIQSGGYNLNSEVYAPRELPLPGSSKSIGNYGGGTCTPSGDTTTLSNALRISCNTAFAQLGMDLGANELRAQAEAFGFDQPLSVPLRVTPSRFPKELDDALTAHTAIGQYDVRVTPLQVALVSAAIANGGIMMEPYLVETVRDPNLKMVSSATPDELGRPISYTTAQQLRTMMVDVVDNGSGRNAQISGVAVAGKTGTAQTGREGEAPHAWFTGFAPANDPQVAVAVVVENGGSMGSEATGGRVSAPIAKQVMEAVLRR